MLRERVLAGGGSYGKGSSRPKFGGQSKVGMRGAEAAGGSGAVEQVDEVERGLVMEGFGVEEKELCVGCVGRQAAG